MSAVAGGRSHSSRFFPKIGIWRSPVTPNSCTYCHLEDYTFLSDENRDEHRDTIFQKFQQYLP